MTALEACDKIEEAISDLHGETKDSGWDWSFTDILTDEQHLANHAESLAKTRAFFEIEDKTTMWFVSTNPGNSLLALCGNSPTAQSRSRYISWANPQNLSLLISRLRTLEAQLSRQEARPLPARPQEHVLFEGMARVYDKSEADAYMDALEAQLSLALKLLRELRLHHSGCRISTEGMPEGGWVDSRCPTCRKLDASGLLGEIGGRR